MKPAKVIRAVDLVHEDDFFAKKWSGKRVVRDAYTPYNDPGLDCSKDPGMTDQSQTNDCDINRILERASLTGVLPGVDVERLYQDYSDVPDFHAAMEIVLHAQEQFDSLDAKVRKRFNNSPVEFLEFANDPGNAQELVNMGLATARPTPPPPSNVVNPPASPEVPVAPTPPARPPRIEA